MPGNDSVRILITGGTGFIGRHAVARLATDHDVLAPTHSELDLADPRAVQRWLTEHPVDVVVHAAAKPGHRTAQDTTDLAEWNLRQFFSLVRCRAEFGRLVVVTSGSIYGTQRSLKNVDEGQIGAEIPAEGHGFAKYIEGLWLARDHDSVELRPFGVYGPGEDYAIRFISNACCKALLGMPVTLRQDRIFSYVSVEDLVGVIERAATSSEGLAPGPYNVTSGEAVSLNDLAGLVVRLSGNDVPVVVGKSGRGFEYTGNGSKLASALPSLAFTPIVEGVSRLLAWYEGRLTDIDQSVLATDR